MENKRPTQSAIRIQRHRRQTDRLTDRATATQTVHTDKSYYKSITLFVDVKVKKPSNTCWQEIVERDVQCVHVHHRVAEVSWQLGGILQTYFIIFQCKRSK